MNALTSSRSSTRESAAASGQGSRLPGRGFSFRGGRPQPLNKDEALGVWGDAPGWACPLQPQHAQPARGVIVYATVEAGVRHRHASSIPNGPTVPATQRKWQNRSSGSPSPARWKVKEWAVESVPGGRSVRLARAAGLGPARRRRAATRLSQKTTCEGANVCLSGGSSVDSGRLSDAAAGASPWRTPSAGYGRLSQRMFGRSNQAARSGAITLPLLSPESSPGPRPWPMWILGRSWYGFSHEPHSSQGAAGRQQDWDRLLGEGSTRAARWPGWPART